MRYFSLDKLWLETCLESVTNWLHSYTNSQTLVIGFYLIFTLLCLFDLTERQSLHLPLRWDHQRGGRAACSSDALTSDLLFQAEDHCHGLVQHQQFGLWLLTLQVQLTHVTQLLERLVDVPHTQTLAGVVGHPPLALTFGLLLRAQVLILVDATRSTRCEKTQVRIQFIV